jgi:hypothetical protein
MKITIDNIPPEKVNVIVHLLNDVLSNVSAGSKIEVSEANLTDKHPIKGVNEFMLTDEQLTIPVVVKSLPCGDELDCEHRWIHNTHTDTKYCSKGCDGFKIQKAN